MRGSISAWVWIAGGLIAGILVFITAYSMLSQTTNALSEAKATEPYYNLKNLAENDLCFTTKGNKRTLDFSLSEEISAVYATDDKYERLNDSDYPKKIIAGEISQGKLLCMKRKDRRLVCEELSCEVRMPYLGAVPEKESLSALIDRILGRHKTFDYQLELLREPDFIAVSKT